MLVTYFRANGSLILMRLHRRTNLGETRNLTVATVSVMSIPSIHFFTDNKILSSLYNMQNQNDFLDFSK